MERVWIVTPVLAVWSVFILNSLDGVYANAEGDALYAFKDGLEDPNNMLQSWDPTLVNPCTWFHVTCDNTSSVTRVDLGNSGLSGPLASSLSKLPNLVKLNLYNNFLTSKIPSEFGSLGNLKILNLSNNYLFGSIPDTLAQLHQLTFLDLHHNALSGYIPDEFGSLSNLIQLDLSTNSLMGVIPPSLAQLTKLETLRLSYNTFEGPIVFGFGSLNGLSVLEVRFNNINGTLPEWSHDNLPYLTTIDLSDNFLSGSVPDLWEAIIQNANTFVNLTFNRRPSGQCTVTPCDNRHN